MKVLFYLDTFLPDKKGGVAQNTYHMAKRLNELGVSVSVLAPEPKNPEPSFPFKVFRYKELPGKRFGKLPSLAYLLLLKKKIGFDVLHAHGQDTVTFQAALFRKLNKTPLVLTPRSEKIIREKKNWHAFYVNARTAFSLKSADVVTALSTSIEEKLKIFGVSPDKIRIVPHGIDCKYLGDYNSGSEYLLFLGRFKHFKGVDILLRSLALSQEKDSSIKTYIAGFGKEEEKLKDLCEKFLLQDKVKFVGPVFGFEKRKILEGARLFVLPSRAKREGFPNVLLEATCASLPVIATSISGAKDFLRKGKFGILVEPEDEEALSFSIVSLWKNPLLRMIFSKRSKEIIKFYNLDRILSFYVKIYEELLEKSKE